MQIWTALFKAVWFLLPNAPFGVVRQLISGSFLYGARKSGKSGAGILSPESEFSGDSQIRTFLLRSHGSIARTLEAHRPRPGGTRLSDARHSGKTCSQPTTRSHRETLMPTQMLVYQPTPISSDARDDNSTEIPHGMLAYFRARLSNRIHELVLSEFAAREREDTLTRSDLARKIRRKPEQITRWLGSSGNWTLDTISDLLLAMDLEPTLAVRRISERTLSHSTPSATTQVSFLKSYLRSAIEVQTAQQVARDMTEGNHRSLYFSLRIPTGRSSYNSKTIEMQPQQALLGSACNVPIPRGEHVYADEQPKRR